MGNMSYCRFENTAADLRDCLENMDDCDLSESEKRARKRIIKMAKQITDDYGDEVE
jgi:hypothetical protein